MAHLQKSVLRYPVKYILFTWWSNLTVLMNGSEDYLKMPAINGVWSSTYFTPSRMDFAEKSKETAHGPVFDSELTAFLPGNFPQLSRILSSFTGKPHIALVVFEDDQRMMMGSEDGGAIFTYSQNRSALGANLSWEFSDSRSLQEVEWQDQWVINSQGKLLQMWSDENTYSLSDQGLFSGEGPSAHLRKISGTKLISI